MKAFTIDAENNITIYPSRKAAAEAFREDQKLGVFSDIAELAAWLKHASNASLVEMYNSFTGVKPVNKFMNHEVGVRRIWAECQKMTVAEAPVEAEPEAPAAKPAKAKKTPASQSQPSAPRETSKTAQLIALLKTEAGMTLDAICATFGWQQHTTRALMSAGGALAKKHGHTVISEKVGEARTYRIAS